MADLKISEMTPAAELTGAELIECVQGGVNVKQELTGTTQAGAAGGIAGDAVHGNSYITWVATGTRYGAIV